MSSMIPARIIQTDKTRDLSLVAQAASINLRSLNSNFEYLFFDDEAVAAFIRREFPQYREVFEQFPFRIQKYDFFRYLAVFRLGGFYFDTDVFLVKGLYTLLTKGCVFPFEELTLNQWLRRQHAMDWEIGNYAFGSTPSHPFIGAIIQNCIKAQKDPHWVQPMLKGLPRLFRSEYYVLNTTGPGLVSRTLAENPDLRQHVCILFPQNVCDSREWHQFGDYGVHMMQGSWRTPGSYLRRRLGHLWEGWAMRRARRESSRLGTTRAPQNGIIAPELSGTAY